MRFCISLVADERGESNGSENQPSIFNPTSKLRRYMNLKKKIYIIIGLIAAILLVGSFFAKSYYGQFACDLLRIFGFSLMLIYSIMVLRQHFKNHKN